jgi:hypothetical protein
MAQKGRTLSLSADVLNAMLWGSAEVMVWCDLWGDVTAGTVQANKKTEPKPRLGLFNDVTFQVQIAIAPKKAAVMSN